MLTSHFYPGGPPKQAGRRQLSGQTWCTDGWDASNLHSKGGPVHWASTSHAQSRPQNGCTLARKTVLVRSMKRGTRKGNLARHVPAFFVRGVLIYSMCAVCAFTRSLEGNANSLPHGSRVHNSTAATLKSSAPRGPLTVLAQHCVRTSLRRPHAIC